MGETTDGGLYEIFQQDYGHVGSPSFEAARENFIVSSAGYAVASLLLQPKDRHNGNLLFDKYAIFLLDFRILRKNTDYLTLTFMPMQRGEACSHWFWFHLGNITWWKYALRECTLQAEPWDDSITRSLWGYEERNLVPICTVRLVLVFGFSLFYLLSWTDFES